MSQVTADYNKKLMHYLSPFICLHIIAYINKSKNWEGLPRMNRCPVEIKESFLIDEIIFKSMK